MPILNFQFTAVSLPSLITQTVQMVNFVLWVEPPMVQADWRCALRAVGGLCVMTCSVTLLQKWPADSSAMKQAVRQY